MIVFVKIPGRGYVEVEQVQSEINAVHARCEDLMKQNDNLSDRIHLDLDPRIARLTEKLDEEHTAYIKRLSQLRIQIGELQERLDNIHEECVR